MAEVGPSPIGGDDAAALTARRQEVVAWLVKSRGYSTALHHLEILTIDRTRDLLRAGADVEGGMSTGLSPLELALNENEALGDHAGMPATMVLLAAQPWRQQTHQFFPAPARARVVELMLVGELLSREERFEAYGPRAVVDAWMGFVVPRAVSRNRVQVVGLKGRPELNGKEGAIGEFNEAKGRFPVHLDDGEAVLVKQANLMAINAAISEEDALSFGAAFEQFTLEEKALTAAAAGSSMYAEHLPSEGSA